MGPFQKAMDLFRKNRFEEASFILLGLFYSESLEDSNKEKFFKILEKCFSHLNDQKRILILQKDYLKVLLSKEDFFESSILIPKILKLEPENYSLKRELYDCYLKVGDLEKAKSLGKSLLEYCLQKKNFTKGLSFVKVYGDLESQKNILPYEFQFSLLKGDKKRVQEILGETKICSLLMKERDKVLNLWQKIDTCILGHLKYWKDSPELILIYLFSILEKIRTESRLGRNHESFQLRKEFVSLIYEQLVIAKEIELLLYLLTEYAEVFEKKELKYILKNLYEDELVPKLGTNKLYFEQKISKLKGIEFFSRESKEFSIADLIEEECDPKEEALKKLERDIKFLLGLKKLNSRDEDKLFKFILELENVEPSHPIIKEYYKKDLVKESDLEEFCDLLTQEIKEQGDLDSNEVEIQNLEDNYISQLKLEGADFCKENFKGLFVAYFSMELWRTCLYLINEADSQDLEIKYLKIRILIKKKLLVKALNLIEEVTTKEALSSEEKKCFFYERADILWKLGKVKEAREIFFRIYQMDSTYRSVAIKVG